jgi:hypothetical protein
VIHEKPLHARRDTVWWEFWAGRLIGPYFFGNEAGNAVTVNGVPYRNMITEFLWPQFGRYGYGRRGSGRTAQPVTLRAKQLELLRENFPGRVISRNGDQNWPLRSCDLTPCDLFLSGFVKSRVYASKP